jgi:hypothetical protein
MCADLAINRPGESLRRCIDNLSSSLGRSTPANVPAAPFCERALRKGLDGEEKVARRLSFLGDGWLSLHSIPVSASGTDIDHLLIGPAGVFTLNTKNHHGQKVWVAGNVFKVNGFDQDYVYCSRAESAKVTSTLTRECGFEVNAEAVIVVLAEYCHVKEDPRDVNVVELEALRFWLRRRPALLAPAQVTAIFEVARDSRTWLSITETSGAKVSI